VGAAGILEEYYSAVRPPHARVFLARSDPAMGHGMLAAVLAVKVALSRLYKLFDRHELPVFPILGVGSLPFRGGLRPSSYARVLDEYRGVHTFTLQSAFRYDFPRWEVEGAISAINSSRPAPPELLEDWEEAALVSIAARCERAYLERVRPLARAVSRVADMLPKRRARKPHAGAFAYARSSGELELPRAIAFTGALYSIDAFGGGFVSQSVLSYWFYASYHASLASLGEIFSIANVITALSIYGASVLADRLGNLRTMVYTHLLSNLFLLLVPVGGTITWAAAFLFLRQSTSQMDVPTRQSMMAELFEDRERVGANALTNTFRTVSSTASPPSPGT
jgi:hypothetical protein